MRLITDRTKITYSMYRAGEVSVHRACYERATQPYFLGGGGTIYPDSRLADVTTRSPRMVAECLLTRSMLIKMYYRFMVCACTCTFVFTVSQFHADVYLVYLVFQFAFKYASVWHNSSIRKHEYDSITPITIQFGESLLSKLSSSKRSAAFDLGLHCLPMSQKGTPG